MESMKQAGVAADIFSYHSFISALRYPPPPTLFTHTTIHVLVLCQHQVMESMKNAEVVPDLLVYHSFITALASARDFKGAEEVLATMRRNSVQVVR